MIPKKNIKYNKSVNQQLDLVNNVQQNDEVKMRNREIRFKYHWVKGTCVACKRDDVLICKKKDSLCKSCFNWCRRKIIEKYGYYNEKHVPEFIVEFRKPVKCRFYHICGNEISRVSKGGRGSRYRKNICPTCYEIYLAGVNVGNAEKRRAKFVGRHRRKNNI